MNHRAEYLLQVLEKIGSPLMASIIGVNTRGNATLQDDAQKIAELLAKTVQTGIDMGYVLDLGPTGEVTDSLRVALTGLAGPLVAASYKNTGKTPSDADIKKMISALQAVLSFAENFAADSDNAGRLQHIAADGGLVDAAQGQVQYIHAMLPVINAVIAFSFGQAEQKLVMDIAARLTQTATQIRSNALGDLGPASKRAELGILRALASLYAACHEAETGRIMAMNSEQRAQGFTLDTVWQDFDTRAAMVEALAGGVVLPQGAASGGFRPSMAPQAPLPQVPAAPPLVSPPAASNPLSMFAKKPSGDTPPPARPATPPPASPPPGGSPMSFFKSPPKTDENT